MIKRSLTKVAGTGLLVLPLLAACSSPPPPLPPPPPPPAKVEAPPPPPPEPPPPPPPEPEKPKLAEVKADEVKLNEQILFKVGSSEIDPKSTDLIKHLGSLLRDNKNLDYVEIAGHADRRGDEDDNRKLTQKRSEEVVRVLVADGVDAKRLRAAGYGSYCPIDTAKSEEAYAKNRRVEFRILRRDGGDLPIKWGGCDAALKAGMKVAAIPATAPKSPPAAGGAAASGPAKPMVITRVGHELQLPDVVKFNPGSAVLLPTSEPILEALRDFLAKETSVTKIRLEGHVDNAVASPSATQLSKDRSKAVSAWLVAHGIDAARLLPVGCGISRPVLDSSGQVDHVRTKRTEAHVITENGKPTSKDPPIPSDCTPD